MRFLSLTLYLCATICSIAGLYVAQYPVGQGRPAWHWAVITLSLVWFCTVAWHEVVSWLGEKHKTFKNEIQINRYMSSWVSNSGRTLIFSRDLSWGQKFNSRTALIQKARSRELELLLKSPTAFSQQLEEEGASVCYYGDLISDPRSRFTIVGFGKEGGRLAIGTQKKGSRIVYEFESGSDPVYAIAEDLAKIIHAAKGI